MLQRSTSTFLFGLALGIFFALQLSSFAPFYSFTWTYWAAWFFVVAAVAGAAWLRFRRPAPIGG